MAILEELQARIERLDDIKQIERLQKIFGYYRDYGEWQKMVDLFAAGEPSVGEADRKATASLHKGELRRTWINGIYENEYVKEDGRWKVKKLHFNLTFGTPYEDGWLKVPVVGQNGPDPVVKADAPSTSYSPYPSGYHVPVHFKHPVTGE